MKMTLIERRIRLQNDLLRSLKLIIELNATSHPDYTRARNAIGEFDKKHPRVYRKYMKGEKDGSISAS